MDFVTLQASLRPRSIAINDVTHQRRWTYAEFDNSINQLVTWLWGNKLKQGDRVACLSKNRAELVALHLACARAGLLFVPLNWRLAKEELGALMADCTPALLIADETAAQMQFNYYDINQLFSDCAGADIAQPEYDANWPSLILYTSGTTGKPKGIIHSEATLMETTINIALLGQVNEHSVFLCETPMFHVIGLVTCIRPALYNGGGLVISDAFEPSRTLNRLADESLGITHYFCVPQMANMLRQHEQFDVSKLKNLKALLTGGAPHPEVQIRAWLRDGIPIVDGYGMSEAGTVFGMPFDLQLLDENAGCVGLATPRVQVRLLDDHGADVAAGEAGEIVLKGGNLFIGIWQQENVYKQCFTADGWFKTGDIAIRNKAGFYRIVDRKKDMFISGGENVYPVEVEGVVLKHPAVKDCALIGVPDERWGEVGHLFVVPYNEDDFADESVFLASLSEHLAKYKIPKYVTLTDAIPRNGAGKILRMVLREQVIHLLEQH
ncbi:AMP-binding protein [Alteromonas lipolytica]|uniref:Acyl-CoA synthetase n=1 Tax=Alteromonas lipolytica TaxID=1856405 RepID=A0A1E8FJY8_9ALTE|nr:AMP-binding protein [Alteromonas lipolytica]OFI35928.1 acyl-CoA synthetase [Alteromonas lipolytica]GGF72515.1 4-coumarate--CoA ligase [Alteromonas lipolytica]